jgi:flagellar biogenesis protein FliO
VAADSSNIGFMNTINKLRVENDTLKHEAELDQQEQHKKYQVSMGIIIALIVAVLFLLRARFVKKG